MSPTGNESLEATVARMDEKVTNLCDYVTDIHDGQKKLQEEVQEARGGMKAALWFLAIIQSVGTALLLWLFTSVLDLREHRAVVDFRLSKMEVVDAKN